MGTNHILTILYIQKLSCKSLDFHITDNIWTQRYKCREYNFGKGIPLHVSNQPLFLIIWAAIHTGIFMLLLSRGLQASVETLCLLSSKLTSQCFKQKYMFLNFCYNFSLPTCLGCWIVRQWSQLTNRMLT